VKTNASPKQLILGLMLAGKGCQVKAAHIVLACSLFGVSENSARVAMARLVAEGQLKSAGRGIYTLGKQAAFTGQDIQGWNNRLTATCAWNGNFYAVFTAHLGRSNRKQLQLREKALALLGFREFEQGLFLRPANLNLGLAGIQEKLLAQGVEKNILAFEMKPVTPSQIVSIQKLWDIRKLEKLYLSHTKKLNDWMQGYSRMKLEKAARDAYLVGSQAIYEVRRDPLLPAEWINAAARQQFFESVLRFDETGTRVWRELQLRILKDEEVI
jgi:phenylacetic acid degradation operon negative regulatory protein